MAALTIEMNKPRIEASVALGRYEGATLLLGALKLVPKGFGKWWDLSSLVNWDDGLKTVDHHSVFLLAAFIA